MKTRDQFGAIPVAEDHEGRLLVLLLTSRETKRWVIPKGWPMKRRTPAQAAAREAFEEAGVRGTTSETPIGSYSYLKRLPSGGSVPCRVTVFLLDVQKELRKWPEKGQRVRQWFNPVEAAELVQEAELADLLRGLGETV